MTNTMIPCIDPATWPTNGYPLPKRASPKDRERWGAMSPDDQRRVWWLIMTGGDMSDRSTPDELKAFISNNVDPTWAAAVTP